MMANLHRTNNKVIMSMHLFGNNSLPSSVNGSVGVMSFGVKGVECGVVGAEELADAVLVDVRVELAGVLAGVLPSEDDGQEEIVDTVADAVDWVEGAVVLDDMVTEDDDC